MSIFRCNKSQITELKKKQSIYALNFRYHSRWLQKGGTFFLSMIVLSVQKLLFSSGPIGGLRLMGKYIDHRLVARPEPDNTFWTDSMKQSCRSLFLYVNISFDVNIPKLLIIKIYR